MTRHINLGGSYTFANTSMTVNRMGYGAMQLAGPQVWGPPRDPDGAIRVLREAVELGVNHIDTSDYYGPHVTNQIIKRALHPYGDGQVIVTKVGRPTRFGQVMDSCSFETGIDRCRSRQPAKPRYGQDRCCQFARRRRDAALRGIDRRTADRARGT